MSTVSINTDESFPTLINYFTVTVENCQPLVDLLNTAIEEVMRHEPGFVSATVHVSFDGMRVLNYAQWRNREDFEALKKNPIAQRRMSAAKALATNEPLMYQVVSQHHAPN